MDWWEALILGIVQGLTEFLPVSSSGHLQIGHALFGIQGEGNLTFAVVVHAATVCSTFFVLWQEVAKLFKGVFRFQWNEETQYIAKIIISMIPVALVGVFFKKQIESIFGSGLFIVGICLFVTAALLAFAYYAKPRQKENISFWDALIVGLAQACAVLPGLSRSGSTISTGLLLGNKKESVATFSFLMVLIPIMGEALLDLLKGNFSELMVLIPIMGEALLDLLKGNFSELMVLIPIMGEALLDLLKGNFLEVSGGIPAFSLITGFAAAFLAGSFACKWMVSIVKKGKLIYFSIYCIVAGMFALGYALFK